MKEQIAKLVDLKSIITLTLIITLEIIVIMVFLKGNMDLIQLVFALFSNVLTMVITYFFTKKQTEKINQEKINQIKEGE